jgi:hypothetical protein
VSLLVDPPHELFGSEAEWRAFLDEMHEAREEGESDADEYIALAEQVLAERKAKRPAVKASVRSGQAIARVARLAIIAWEESEHRRGKTSPGTTPGSFAPKGDDEGEEYVPRAPERGPERSESGDGAKEQQVGAQTGGKTEPAGGKKASPGVPDSLVQAIEDHVEAMVGEGSRHGAADLSRWLALAHRDEILKLIDESKDKWPILLLHKGDKEKDMPTVWLLSWSKADNTSIHDHLESEVGVSVARGSVGNRAYSTGEGYLDKAKTKEGLESRSGDKILKRNQTLQINAPYIHEMYGTAEAGQKRDVTVHAYYPPLSQMHYFKKDQDGKLHYAGDWDEDRDPEDVMVDDPQTGEPKPKAHMGNQLCMCCRSVNRELARWNVDAPRPSVRSRDAMDRTMRAARLAFHADAGWDESKHPRGPSAPGHSGGEFTEKGGGERGGGAKESGRERKSEPYIPRSPERGPERSEDADDEEPEPKRNGKAKAKPSSDKPSIEQADKIKAAWVAASPHTSVDSLVEHAPANQDELVALSKQIERDTGARLHNPGVKKRERIEEKLKVAGRKPQSIADAVRLGFEVSTPEQGEEIVKRLKQKYLVADEGWQMKPVGYFDRKVTVRFADGMMGEIQLWPTIMLVAKQSRGHVLYEKARTLPKGPAKAKAEEEMSDFYHSLDVPNAWREELGIGGR